MLLTEAVDAYFVMARGPSQMFLEDNPEIHAAFQAAIGGDKNAWNKLAQHYYPTLLRLATSRAKNSEDASDAVQDVFTKIGAGGFSHMNIETPQGVTAVLMRSVMNAVSNKNSKLKAGPTATGIADIDPETGKVQRKTYKLKAKPIGTDADVGEVDPAAPEAKGFSDHEKGVVRGAFARAAQDPKMTPQEREFISKLYGDGSNLQDIEYGKEAEIAAQVWPEKVGGAVDPNDPKKGLTSTIRVHARRVRERFLKKLCGDKELNAIVPTGHEREAGSSALHSMLGKVKAVCGEEIASFSLRLGLISEDERDADKVYDAVIAWVKGVLAS